MQLFLLTLTIWEYSDTFVQTIGVYSTHERATQVRDFLCAHCDFRDEEEFDIAPLPLDAGIAELAQGLQPLLVTASETVPRPDVDPEELRDFSADVWARDEKHALERLKALHEEKEKEKKA